MSNDKITLVYQSGRKTTDAEAKAIEAIGGPIELRNGSQFHVADVEFADVVYTDDESIVNAYKKSPRFSVDGKLPNTRKLPEFKALLKKSTPPKKAPVRTAKSKYG